MNKIIIKCDVVEERKADSVHKLLRRLMWPVGILLLATVVAGTMISAASVTSVHIPSFGSIIDRSAVISAVVDIRPETLNLKSNGRWTTVCVISLEGYSVDNIKPGSVKLGGIAAAWSKVQNNVFIGKFEKALVLALLTDMPDYHEDAHSKFTLVVTGELVNGQRFEGKDTVHVVWC